MAGSTLQYAGGRVSDRSLQSFDFNDHIVVAVDAISGTVEQALVVLVEATGKGIVASDERDGR
jgi:hypothetical protein